MRNLDGGGKRWRGAGSAAFADAAASLLQHLEVHVARSKVPWQPATALLADLENYLNGFSPNIQDILDNFKFRNQLTTPPQVRRDSAR